MKIAEQIAEKAEKAFGCARYEEADVITVTQAELADLVAVELRPLQIILQKGLYLKLHRWGRKTTIALAGVIFEAVKFLREEE